MDVMFPAASSGQWRALFQTDPFNHDGNDAEFYVGNSASLPDPNGLGAEGQFNGSLAPDTWYRIAFAVDLAAPAGQQLSKYVNGVKVGEQSLSGGVDGRYALGPRALLFTAGLSGGFTQPGFVSSIQFVNGWMSPEAIAALGGPSADKLPPGNAAIRVTNVTLNASLMNLGWTGPEALFQVQTAANLGHPDWQTISNASSNRSLSVPTSSQCRLLSGDPASAGHPGGTASELRSSRCLPNRFCARRASNSSSAAGRWTWRFRPTAGPCSSRT